MIFISLPAAVIALAVFMPSDAPQKIDKAKIPDKAKEEQKLPITKLAPAKIFPNLCLLKYRVSTNSPECQTYFDQGLGYFYSYVWMEAARSFETAAKYDPNCAMAWWGLSRACESWTGGAQNDGVRKAREAMNTSALNKAKELMNKADLREKKLILARLQDKGLADGNLPPDKRRAAAQRTIDELLIVDDRDQEAWYARAQLSDEFARIAYYKALLMINPIHPGANHELVHYYEGAQRPALGFPYAEKYLESSPGIPHAFHMQAHLATRIGRWDKTADRSARAIELERQYHKIQNVDPKDDDQYSHHLEVLTISLVHDGRFQEARKIKAEAEKVGKSHWMPWFHLYFADHDWKETAKIIEHYRKENKSTAAYLAALVSLKQGDLPRAAIELETLRQGAILGRHNETVDREYWEVLGMLLCKTGTPETGLKLLQRTVDKTKNNFGHHSWGNGAYYMEEWGLCALEAGRWEIAEEGLLEALAHDPASVRAALGLEALCRRQGRIAEADRYSALAKKFWKKADVEAFLALKEEVSRMPPTNSKISAPAESNLELKSDNKTENQR
jgi:tetratricopeptide (TPR) repeat protein